MLAMVTIIAATIRIMIVVAIIYLETNVRIVLLALYACRLSPRFRLLSSLLSSSLLHLGELLAAAPFLRKGTCHCCGSAAAATLFGRISAHFKKADFDDDGDGGCFAGAATPVAGYVHRE